MNMLESFFILETDTFFMFDPVKLQSTPSRVSSVGMFANGIALLGYIKLHFTPKQIAK